MDRKSCAPCALLTNRASTKVMSLIVIRVLCASFGELLPPLVYKDRGQLIVDKIQCCLSQFGRDSCK
jgi:hypothetical protein